MHYGGPSASDVLPPKPGGSDLAASVIPLHIWSWTNGAAKLFEQYERREMC